MVKSAAAAKGAKSTTTNPSGLSTRVKTLSRIALGMTEYIYGLNPEYETIVTDMHSAGIAVDIELMKRCLKAVDDLYVNLPEVRETLGKVILGIAICHFDHDPKASRSKATSRIAKALEGSDRSVTVDTILRRLREAASELDMA